MSESKRQGSILYLLQKSLFGHRSEPAPGEVPQHSMQLRRPTSDDRNAWCAYWQAQGRAWRTEPEIDRARQEYLARCRLLTPNIEQGIYPFKGEKLSRADVEWLLVTHENRRGPVDWCDESQREREGIDLRGADLCEIDLSSLPLIQMIGGLNHLERAQATEEQSNMAAVLMKGTNLRDSRLEKATLDGAHLEKADLNGAHLEEAALNHSHLEEAALNHSHLEGASLSKAHLERADLIGANLQDVYITQAHLEGASMVLAHFEKAILRLSRLERAVLKEAHLEGADLGGAHLEGAILHRAYLKGTDLRCAYLEGATLSAAHLEGAHLGGAHLEGKKMAPEDLGRVRNWVEDFPETLLPAELPYAFFDNTTRLEGVILGEKNFGSVSLLDVSWGDVNLTRVEWASVKTLGDERKARQWALLDEQVKRQETQLDLYRQAVQTNRQLSVVLRNQGLNEDAARFAYRAQVLQKTVFRLQMLQPSISLRQRGQAFGAWLFSWFLFLLAGYGYRLWRSFAAYILVIGGFATAYYLLGPTAKLSLSPLDAIIFSVTSFHGRGFSPGETIGLSNPLTIFAAIEAFVGLVIEVTLIATLTQRFFGR